MKKANSIITLIIFLGLILACSGGGKPAPPKFQGNWAGEDGSTLYLDKDGTAGFRVGNKKVTGGGAEFSPDGKSFTISLFGISHEFKIDQEPNEKGEMKLNGTLYRKR